MAKPVETRERYRHFQRIPTRWSDNDIYGHVNNVVYYSYFDTVVNTYLIERGALDIRTGTVIGLAIESLCTFKKELTYPETIEAGIRVGRLGNTSVRYEIGLFRAGEDDPAATGYFVHVYVDRETRKPVPLPETLRRVLEPLTVA
ncbi:MAG: acyl-CoA thioesterase [Rhodospirillaceae bacterium]|nr:acyl-CoA thioesterase [Rhodospirillaceae bacterium]